jgi:hypothetical protein
MLLAKLLSLAAFVSLAYLWVRVDQATPPDEEMP